jgi:hypothetical protein
MVRIGSTINLSKFDLKVINCKLCADLLDTTQKPLHKDVLLNPSPILFIREQIDEIDSTTQSYLTAPWGKWLQTTMDTFLSRKDWTVHTLTMCPVPDEVAIKQVKHNCLYHFNSLITMLAPYKVVYLGIKNIPANKTYISKTLNCIFLDDPAKFVPMDNRLAMSRFTLTMRKLCDEKTCN